MRTKNATLNIVASIIFRVLTVLSALIVTEKFIVIYGSSINGLRSSILQFVNYLTIIELGLSDALIYLLYKPIANRDYAKINSIVYAGHKSYISIGKIFSVFLLILALIYPLIIAKNELGYISIFLFVIQQNPHA